jgi:hypothetical protein
VALPDQLGYRSSRSRYATSRHNAPLHIPTTALSRESLDSIDTSTLVGRRDRALIAVMTPAFARVGVVVSMRIEELFILVVAAAFVER